MKPETTAGERAAEALRCFPLPSQSTSATENYRRVLEWLYRDHTDRLITDLVMEECNRVR